MTSSLFISYASDDQAVALEVCALLEAQGVRCWIAPRDVTPGAKWDEAILDAIESSAAFLLILTAAANQSPYVSNEVNEAFEKKKAIFTFRAEEVVPGKALKFYLGRSHWVDGFGRSQGEAVAQLAAGVKTLTGAGAQASEVATTVVARPGGVVRIWRRVTPRRGWLRDARVAWSAAVIASIASAGAASWLAGVSRPVAGEMRVDVVTPTTTLPEHLFRSRWRC